MVDNSDNSLSEILLDNWKNATLEVLHETLTRLNDEILDFEVKIERRENVRKVISYYIGLKEGQLQTKEKERCST